MGRAPGSQLMGQRLLTGTQEGERCLFLSGSALLAQCSVLGTSVTLMGRCPESIALPLFDILRLPDGLSYSVSFRSRRCTSATGLSTHTGHSEPHLALDTCPDTTTLSVSPFLAIALYGHPLRMGR